MIRETNYEKEMTELVLPYLQARKESLFLTVEGDSAVFRTPNQRIYCEFFTSDSNGGGDDTGELPPDSHGEDSAGGKASNGEDSTGATFSLGARPRGIVLISHGFTETAEKFYEMIYYFLQAGFHVCVIEHSGHGSSYRLSCKAACEAKNPADVLSLIQSSSLAERSLVHIDRYERFVEDLRCAAFAAREKWPGLPLILYAHSMGGGIGASLAAREPQLFDRLILSSPMIRPLTNGIPYPIVMLITRLGIGLGRSCSYVIGHKPYHDDEKFENSASTSPSRFVYYSAIRSKNPLYQMNGASYCWLREAGRMNRYLMREGCKKLKTPLLLFQSEIDDFVSNEEEERFVQKINAAGGNARLVSIAGGKHELYNQKDGILEGYLKELFAFLGGVSGRS